MIVKPIIEAGNIYIFTMVGGNEFCGQVESINKPWILLIKPLFLNRIQQGGKITLQWAPVLQGNPFLAPDQAYPINGNLVLACAKPNKAMTDAYRQSRSNIIIDQNLANSLANQGMNA